MGPEQRGWSPPVGVGEPPRPLLLAQTLALVDGIPPVAGRPGRPRRRPAALLCDKGYDSNAHRDELRHRRILPVISRKGSPNSKGIGKRSSGWDSPNTHRTAFGTSGRP
ncbi:hypothetical protein [Streptomyces sp. NPDC088727]|uniref:hypothetical protein n=1 Tax=Streptomyces sp. NPDC088727 TaxID=3365875 RepID=UPI003807DD12